MDIKFNKEIQKIIDEKWNIFDDKWEKPLKYIKDDNINYNYQNKTISSIQGIKSSILYKLDYLPVYFFLNILFDNYSYSGQYRNIDKGIMLLYQLINGGNKSKYNQLMKGFNKVYNEFWINRFDELDKKVDYFLKNLFSNIDIRSITSEMYNPEQLKISTFIFDTYLKTYNSKNGNFLYEKGYITPIMCDCNGIVTYVSDVKIYCQEKKNGFIYDDMFFWDVALDIHQNDTIAINDSYYKYKEILINNTKIKYKKDISNNFITNIVDNNLETEDINYNNDFYMFQDISNKTLNNIENIFTLLQDEKHIRYSDIRDYQLQLKISILLYNIKIYSEKYNINIKNHHKYWMDLDFNFKNLGKEIIIPRNLSNNVNKYIQKEVIKKKEFIRKNYLEND
jgi:hypothetical protein